MSDLPVVELPSRIVEIRGGDRITVQSLTRKEATHVNIGFHVADTTDLVAVEAAAAACEAYILARGLGVTVEEATRWSDATDSSTIDAVLDAILILSGLKAGDGPDPKVDTSEPLSTDG